MVILVQKFNGKKISRPGIYADVPMSVYHGDCCTGPSISSTGLRRMLPPLGSPEDFYDSCPYNPDRAESEDTKSLLLGRMAHFLIFGDQEFKKAFVKQPELTPQGDKWQNNRTYCKAWRAKQIVNGLAIFTQDMLDQVECIAKALSKHPLVRAGILNGEIERSWFWQDKETGVWLKARPDATPNDSMDFADLKLTSSVYEDDLRRTIRTYGYFQQGAMMAMACKELLAKDMHSFTLVFVKSTRPHSVHTITLEPADIALGIRSNRLALRKFVHGMKTGEWPGPNGVCNDARYLAMKDWDRKAIDEMLKQEGA